MQKQFLRCYNPQGTHYKRCRSWSQEGPAYLDVVTSSLLVDGHWLSAPSRPGCSEVKPSTHDREDVPRQGDVCICPGNIVALQNPKPSASALSTKRCMPCIKNEKLLIWARLVEGCRTLACIPGMKLYDESLSN